MEVILPQGMGKFFHHREGNADFLHFNGCLDRPLQTFIVRHGILQGRRFQPEIQSLEIIVKADSAFPQIPLAGLKNGNFLRTAQIGSLHAAAIGRSNIRNEHRAVRDHPTVAA